MPRSYLIRSAASCGVEYTMTDAGDADTVHGVVLLVQVEPAVNRTLVTIAAESVLHADLEGVGAGHVRRLRHEGVAVGHAEVVRANHRTPALGRAAVEAADVGRAGRSGCFSLVE